MTPCAIPDCPALALSTGRWCAAHAAMSELERTHARITAEAKQQGPNLRPITDRIVYEREKP